jgi:hypothetical protein
MKRESLEIHEGLKPIGARRAALDAEEMRLLRRMGEVRLWEEFGMVSPLDYLERKCGYTPKTASDRLRLAEVLADLPALEAALANHDLDYSAVRELARVATPETEAEWIAKALDKNLREIEPMVSGRKRGDRPTDSADPEIRPLHVHFELAPETYARLRQAGRAWPSSTDVGSTTMRSSPRSARSRSSAPPHPSRAVGRGSRSR